MRLLLLFFFMYIYVQMNAQNEPVFPGDFNMDGVVTIHDALYWGLAHGETGPARMNDNTDWLPQTADDWEESIRLANNKFQDGNGDGVIDTFDLEVLYQNFDSTHVYIIKDSITEQNYVSLEHHATESGGIRDNRYELRIKDDTLHGIAFTFDYSNYGDAAIDVGVSIEGLLTENDGIVVEVLKETDYQLHIAITRTDQTNFLTEGDVVANIVICEDVASLISPAEVYIKNGEIIKADERRQYINIYPYQTPQPPKPECKTLWNGEQCLYENGTINAEEVEYDFAFEGWLYNEKAGIEMGCHRLLGEDISNYDTLSFIIKSDEEGRGEAVKFFIADVYGNYSNPFIVNNLDTTFTSVKFPLDMLINEDSVLQAVEWIYFEAVGDGDGFTIYADEIILNDDWSILWNGQKCTYRDGTLNEEHARNGRYSFERIINEYEWNHSLINLYCEQDMTLNLSESDEIRFYAKADQMGKTFDFYVSEAYRNWGDCNTLNISDYIEEGELTDDYRLVSIPLDSLKNENCLLERVQEVHFFNPYDIDFQFYIDDVSVYSENCITPVTPAQIDNSQVIIYPNPASESISIQLHTQQSTQGEIRIFDMQGQLLDRLSIHFTTGINTFTYASAHLSPGVYVIHIQNENEIFNGKFMIFD